MKLVEWMKTDAGKKALTSVERTSNKRTNASSQSRLARFVKSNSEDGGKTARGVTNAVIGGMERFATPAREAQAEYEERLTYDAIAGQSDISKLSSNVSRIEELTNSIFNAEKWLADYEKRNWDYRSRYKHRYDNLTKNLPVFKSELDELNELYEGRSLSNLRSELHAKKAYHDEALNIKKNYTLVNDAVNADDFLEQGVYRSSRPDTFIEKLFDIPNSGYGDTEHEYINSTDADERHRIEAVEELRRLPLRASGLGVLDILFGDENSTEKGYGHLNEEELSIYNYYYNTEGKEKAEEYLSTLSETLKYRKASEDFKWLDDKIMLEYLYGVYAGLDSAKGGLHGVGDAILGRDDDTSAIQYTSGMVREDLADKGPRVLGSSLGRIGYDLVNTTANMLPSILVGTLNPIAGAAVMGASSAGNAYNEMIQLGYSVKQARTYGILVGASEAGLQYMLGGISKLGGRATGKIASSVATKLDNALAKLAINHPLLVSGIKTAGKIGVNMAGEATEEGLQTVLEPLFKSWAANETYLSPDFEEIAYSALLGALSAGVLEGTHTIAGDTISYNRSKEFGKAIVESGQLDALKKLGKTAPNDTAAYQLADLIDKDTNGYATGQYFKQVGEGLSEQNVKDLVKGLERRGYTAEKANTIAGYINKALNGDELSRAQRDAVYGDDAVVDVMRSVFFNENHSVNQRNAELDKIWHKAELEMANRANAKNGKSTTPSSKVSAGDTFKDTKTGNTVTVLKRDAEKTTVKIDTGKKSEIRELPSNQMDNFAANGQLEKVGIIRADGVQNNNDLKSDETKPSGYVGSYSGHTYTKDQERLMASLTADQLTNAIESNTGATPNALGIAGTPLWAELERAGLVDDGVLIDAFVVDERQRRFEAEKVARIADAHGENADSTTRMGKEVLKNESESGIIEEDTNVAKTEIEFKGGNINARAGETISDAVNAESTRGMGEKVAAGARSNTERIQRKIKEILRKSTNPRHDTGDTGRGSARLEQRETSEAFERRTLNDGYRYATFSNGKSSIAYKNAPRSEWNGNAKEAAKVLEGLGFAVVVFDGDLRSNNGGVTQITSEGATYGVGDSLTIFVSSKLNIDGLETAYHEAFHALRRSGSVKNIKLHYKMIDIISSGVDVECEAFEKFVSTIIELYSYEVKTVSIDKFWREITEEFYSWYIGIIHANKNIHSLDMLSYIKGFSDVDNIKTQLDAIFAEVKTNTKSLEIGTSPKTESKSGVKSSRDTASEGKTATVADYAAAYGDQAQAVISTYNLGGGTQNAAVFAREYELAYSWGESGVRDSYISKPNAKEATSSLTDAQRELAYRAGRDVYEAQREADVKARQAAVNKAKAEAAAKLQTESTEGGKPRGKVYIGEGVQAVTAIQKKSVKVLDIIAKALGINIYVYDSKHPRSEAEKSSDGWYDPSDNSIHIDIHAGRDARGTMMYTAAHELTHLIKQWSPEKYKIFSDFLLSQYAVHGADVETLIAAQIDKAERYGDTISRDEALDEVIADACERMLLDSDALTKLSELANRGAEEQGLVKKLRDYMKRLMSSLRKLYNTFAVNSHEAELVAEMRDAAEELYQLFEDALMDAAEVSRAVGTLGGESGAIHSKKAIDNNSDVGYNKEKDGDFSEEDKGYDTRGSEQSVYGGGRGSSSQNENGSRVQERHRGRDKEFKNEALSGKSNTKRALRFPKENIIEPTVGSVEYIESRLLIEEYGIETYVIKKTAWDKENDAYAYRGTVYIREVADADERGVIAPHEATHIMKQLRYAPYMEFLSRTPSLVDIGTRDFRLLLTKVEEHIKADVISEGEKYETRLYDEFNAAVYGSYMGEANVGSVWNEFPDAFYDFDAYISELHSIHEQFKRENTAQQRQKKGYVFSRKAIDDMSPRELLADAFESVAQNDIERERLVEYRAKRADMEAAEDRLYEVNREIRELSFAKGKRDTVRLSELREEKRRLENNINTYDKMLLRLESAKALQNVVEREKKKAYARAELRGKQALAKQRERDEAKFDAKLAAQREHFSEVRENERERRRESELRGKIKSFKAKLEKSLLSPTDTRYVPDGLAQAMIEVCGLIDTDTELYKVDGSINKAQAARERTKAALLTLADEYKALTEAKGADDSGSSIYAGEFDEVIFEYIDDLRRNSGKALPEMDLDELSELYDTLRAIDETLRDARKFIGFGEALDVFEAGNSIMAEQRAIASERRDGKRSAAQKVMDKIDEYGLSPVRAVERMSGYNEESFLVKLTRGLESGVRKANKFFMDAHRMFEGVMTGEYAKAYEDAMYKPTDNVYTDKEGHRFKVTKMQMMQAVLSMEREEANKKTVHIERDGLSFADLDMLKKGKLNEATSAEYSHRVSGDSAVKLVESFKNELADDSFAQAYMAVARTFFNDMAKDALNEASLAVKHRIVAREKNYIPFEVDQNFVGGEITDSAVQQTINSYSVFKELQSGAGNPLVMTGLNNIIERHIDKIGTVYGLAVPVRDFNKIWKLKSPAYSETVKSCVERTWGKNGAKLIEQAVKDIQGSRPGEHSAIYQVFKSNYITSTFTLNLSVVTKQIGSLFSSTSMLRLRDPVSMMANLAYTMAHSEEIAAEVDKYTASAWMRKQGMSDAELHTFFSEGKKGIAAKLFAKLPTAISPPKWIAAMDYSVALSLWKYAKEDVALRTGLEGEELLRATAEFYDSVIENTQSMSDVLHRPEIQKRKDVISESFSMFKTDLYQMAGQLQVAWGRYRANDSAENKAALGRTLYSVAMSAVWNQLMTTLFALIRYSVARYRDDEDELTMASWLKRQAFGLAGDFAGYIMPIFGSELVGVAESLYYGEFDDIVDNVAIDAVNNGMSALYTVADSIADGEMMNFDLARKLAIKTLGMFGIPASNINRIVNAVALHAKDLYYGEFGSFKSDPNLPKSKQLYVAAMRGDDGGLDQLRDTYKTEDSYRAALRKALRENDPRIGEAAKARADGNLDAYERIIGELISEGHFDEADIIASMGTAYNSLTKQEDSTNAEEGKDKAVSIWSTSDIGTALDGGDTKRAKDIIAELIDTKIKNGATKKDAMSSLKSGLTTYYKAEYIAANAARRHEIRKAMYSTGLYDSVDDVTSLCENWLKKSK